MRYALFFLFALLPLLSAAQAIDDPRRFQTQNTLIQPQPVPEYYDDIADASWYNGQSALWKALVFSNSKNADAWLNYYKARRYGMGYGPGAAIPAYPKQPLDSIVGAMAREVPNTFEYEYLAWLNGNGDTAAFAHLQKAAQLSPSRKELYREFCDYYAQQGDTAKLREWCTKWKNSGTVPPSVINYARNVFRSLDQNAVIYTKGTYDTYPLIMLQYTENLRKDVLVIKTGWKGKNNLFVDFTKKHTTYDTIQQPQPNPPAGTPLLSGAYSIVAHQHYAIYYALTISAAERGYVPGQLYLTGLAMRASTTKYDNLPELKKNIAAFDFSMLSTGNDRRYAFNQNAVWRLNYNYVLPLLLAMKEEEKSGNTTKAATYKTLALNLARQAGREAEVTKYLNEK